MQFSLAFQGLLFLGIHLSSLTREGVLHNTVEIYGRAVTFDIYRVCDRPPLYSAHYDGVWPLTRDLDGQEGQKLVLKTYALHARVTSSITLYE